MKYVAAPNPSRNTTPPTMIPIIISARKHKLISFHKIVTSKAFFRGSTAYWMSAPQLNIIRRKILKGQSYLSKLQRSSQHLHFVRKK